MIEGVTYDPANLGRFALLANMYVERGTKHDWDLLHHLHYKIEGKVMGAHFYRLVLNDETIGVTALTLPRPLLKERHKVFPKLKPGSDTRMVNTKRYAWINQNVRVIGRIVLDTMYRGVGASYRFQNVVSRMSGFKYVEIQSSMSKYNLFAQKAGFKFVKPMVSNKYDAGIKFFRQNFESHPADTEMLLAEIAGKNPTAQTALIARTRHFYFAHSALEKTGNARKNGTSRVDAMPVPELIKNMQQLVLASPLYGIYANPDAGRTLPARIPLMAFDRQDVSKPLICEVS